MRRRPVLATLGLLVLLALTGCGIDAGSEGTVVPPPLAVPTVPASTTDSTTASDAATDAATGAPLSVVDRGLDGRLLSLVVRNDGDRTIRSGRVRITVWDHHRHVLLRSSGPVGSTCCSVVGLSPGARFGLFLNLPAGRVAHAGSIGAVEVQLLPEGRRLTSAPAPRLRVDHATLARSTHDAIVTARVTTPAGTTPYVAGQAFLTDRRGHLVAVISGRFYCFDPHDSRVLRMQLLHPVPRGTRIGAVHAFAVPRHDRATSTPACPGA